MAADLTENGQPDLCDAKKAVSAAGCSFLSIPVTNQERTNQAVEMPSSARRALKYFDECRRRGADGWGNASAEPARQNSDH